MFQVVKGGGLEPIAERRSSAKQMVLVLVVFKRTCQVALVLAFVAAVLVLNSHLFSWADKQDESLRKASVRTQAGAVLDVDLHPSMLFNTTTVKSTTGQIYQVKGAVSATIDDVLTTKTKEPGVIHLFDGNSLCVQSKDRQVCYSLL